MVRSDFFRQVKALTKKNLLLLVTRHWLGTLLQALVAPVLIYGLLLNIRNYSPTSNRYGNALWAFVGPVSCANGYLIRNRRTNTHPIYSG